MKILYLETSSKNCSVAIAEGEELLCVCEEVSENYKQSESLHIFVQWALEGAGIQLQDLDAICLGKGPGSYTGLRIGAAAAKGFCFGLQKPLIAVNSMESMIFPYLQQGYDYLIPLIDARRMEVYCAVYDGKSGEVVQETSAKILDESSFKEWEGKKILFLGDGAKKAQSILQILGSEYKSEVFPSAKTLVNKGVDLYTKNAFEDVAYFEPFYLKEFHVEKKKKNDDKA